MRKTVKKESYPIDPLAQQVWEDVIYSMDQYTHDSEVSKFFLPDEIITQCRTIAAAFAQIHYMPIPSTTEVYKTRLFGLFFLAMTCGVQIYLKERSVFMSYAPYTILQDAREIREARRKIFRQLEDGIEVFSPIDEVMELFIKQLTPVKAKIIRYTKDLEFNDKLFDKILPITLMWGYLFAKEMIIDEKR